MHIRVKLLGTLSSCCQGTSQSAEIDMEIPAGSTVAALAERTGLSREQVAIVTINGLLAKADDRVPENAVVKFMQPVTGG